MSWSRCAAGPYAGAVGYIGWGAPDPGHRDRHPDLRDAGRPGLGPGRRRHRGRLRPGGGVAGNRSQGPGGGDGAGAGRGTRRRTERSDGQAGVTGFSRPLPASCRTPTAHLRIFPPHDLPPHLSVTGDQDFELAGDHAYVVGRAVDSDIPIFDPTISRRHAELRVSDDRGPGQGPRQLQRHLHQRRPDHRRDTVEPGDSVTFGKVVFQLKSPEMGSAEPADHRPEPAAAPGGTIVSKIAMSGGCPA